MKYNECVSIWRHCQISSSKWQASAFKSGLCLYKRSIIGMKKETNENEFSRHEHFANLSQIQTLIIKVFQMEMNEKKISTITTSGTHSQWHFWSTCAISFKMFVHVRYGFLYISISLTKRRLFNALHCNRIKRERDGEERNITKI